MVKDTEHRIPYVAFLVDYLEYGYRVQKLESQVELWCVCIYI